MDLRRVATALGAGITTFLIGGAFTIELVGVDIVAGIVGVLVGATAGAVAVALVWFLGDRPGPIGRSAVEAYAAFGYTFLLLSALSYVNAPGARTTLTVPINVAIGAVAAGATFLVTWSRRAVADRHR